MKTHLTKEERAKIIEEETLRNEIRERNTTGEIEKFLSSDGSFFDEVFRYGFIIFIFIAMYAVFTSK